MGNNKASSWRWERWIAAEEEAVWALRLESYGSFPWLTAIRPGRSQLLLQAYFPERTFAERMRRELGGRVAEVKAEAWLKPKATPPLRIGNQLLIVSSAEQRNRLAKAAQGRALVIPQGLAFGSGEHATTGMMLRALARWPKRSWPKTKVLDLGTGSGVLALAARYFRATEIKALDFEKDSIRTARENERLNFKQSRIHWQRADVLRGPVPVAANLVLANLFSGLLIQAAPRVWRMVQPGGQLWLSGILREQEEEVTRAYRRLGLKWLTRRRRGKWVLLQGRRPV